MSSSILFFDRKQQFLIQNWNQMRFVTFVKITQVKG